ncbi:MAG: hypothetical protein R3Y54_08150 [Eubacteriales bacterium]
MQKYANEKGKINVSDWKKEHSSLVRDISLCEWKRKELKQEIGSAEKVQKILEEEREDIKKVY